MDDDRVITLRGVNKSYSLETRPVQRLWRQLTGRTDAGRQHHALHNVNLSVRRGEVVGVIGRNGAGKSTLLQVICGVLQPSSGQREVRGRIAALLELGAGFNPELTGRENVRLNGPLLGLSTAELMQSMDAIVDFAGIGEYIDQPVRSYSSGMFMRLAFSMATSVDPDVLIVDEALSVGDGAFAHKSFERIMSLKERGATILFCSHSMFQVEALCQRAIWIEAGAVRFDGPAHQATVEYSEWLARVEQGHSDGGLQAARFDSPNAAITKVMLHLPEPGPAIRSGEQDLSIEIELRSDPQGPVPTLGVVLYAGDGRSVSSAGNWLDGAPLVRRPDGSARALLTLPRLPLLKGHYTVSAYVLCERSINVWAAAEHVAKFEVEQDHLEQGVVSLPHHWRMDAPA
jgi:lipopolysaccharide transport system ATP-binding protein